MAAFAAAVLILGGVWLLLVRSGLVLDRLRGRLEAYVGYHGIAPLTHGWDLAEIARIEARPQAVKALLAPETDLGVVVVVLKSGEEVELIAPTKPGQAQALAEELMAGLPLPAEEPTGEPAEAEEPPSDPAPTEEPPSDQAPAG
jgi:hypothetical protein